MTCDILSPTYSIYLVSVAVIEVTHKKVQLVLSVVLLYKRCRAEKYCPILQTNGLVWRNSQLFNQRLLHRNLS